MYHVSTQGIDEHMINVHYYDYHQFVYYQSHTAESDTWLLFVTKMKHQAMIMAFGLPWREWTLREFTITAKSQYCIHNLAVTAQARWSQLQLHTKSSTSVQHYKHQ